MPWSVKDVDRFKKGLTAEQKAKWVSIANSALASCKTKGGTDCEGSAIKIANSQTGGKMEDKVNIVSFSLDKKSISDIETEEQDDGLLVKGIPVFKTGKHRETDYTEKFIDNVLINQFDVKENIPVQADHSDSYKDTLGYVKKLVRKGKMLYADMILLADNAVARWNKGLMKKWSVSMYLDGRGLREISAVAFPYVKEASVLSEVEIIDNPREKGKDHIVEEGQKGPKIKREIIEIEARDLRKELDGKSGKISHNEENDTYTIELQDDTPATEIKSSKNTPTHEEEETGDDNTITKKKDNMSEEEDMDEKKMDELAELKAKEMLKEASEREEKISDELKDKTDEATKLAEEKAELEKKLDVAAINETVAELKKEGKVLPAEEEKVAGFIATLSQEQRTEYVEMLKATDPKVDLDESGEQTSEQDDSKKDEFAVDFDEMSSDEIEAIVAKYAEAKGIPEADARDIIYDKAENKKE